MKTTLCTLFNSLYLDKGLVLYDSLKACAKDFELYVLCMDDKCYDILNDIDDEQLKPIRLDDFENSELLSVKKDRKLGEYFWTCSSWLISYILDNYHPQSCSYIDADMYFYQDPSVLIEEMGKKSASVLIVGHRFHPLLFDERSRIVGRYCVEFNTFKNEDSAKNVLDVWKRQVIERCSLDGDGIHWGDQKYLDNWTEDYDSVLETSNLGAGVAPWNLSQYRLYSDKDSIVLKHDSGVVTPLVFYHFENIQYLDEHMVNANIECFKGTDLRLIKLLYCDYLKKIRNKKILLKEKYGIDVLIKSHVGVQSDSTPISAKIVKGVKRFAYQLSDCKNYVMRLRRIMNCYLPAYLHKQYNIISF